MRNYIEFRFDEENRFMAEIHKQGKVRVIRNDKNLNQLIAIAKKYDCEVNGECRIYSRVFAISREYEEYYKKRRRRINILGKITPNMKLSKKDKTIGKTVIAGTLAAVVLATSIASINHKGAIASSTDSSYEVALDDQMEYEAGNEIVIEGVAANTGEDEEIVEGEGNPEKEAEIQGMMQEESFHYSYKNRQEEENISNARRYEDLFQKYGDMYGIDANLLMAIAAQESCGDHYNNLDNGPAEGIMQIEKSVHIGYTVSAYNFETGEVETIRVTREDLQDLETNIKIGAMILRTSIENSNYNIPLGIQTYNLGPGNMSNAIGMCCDLENVSESDIRDNPTNNIWLNYRAFLNTGDSKYVEHVFSFMDDNTTITVLDREGNPITVRITNDYERENVY